MKLTDELQIVNKVQKILVEEGEGAVNFSDETNRKLTSLIGLDKRSFDKMRNFNSITGKRSLFDETKKTTSPEFAKKIRGCILDTK